MYAVDDEFMFKITLHTHTCLFNNASIGPTVPKGVECYSTPHAVGLYRVSEHAGARGNEIADMLAKDGSALKFVGPESALGVSRQDIQRKIRRCLVNQHWVWWRVPGDTQRQARELISGPCLGAKATFLSFNRTIQGCYWPSHWT